MKTVSLWQPSRKEVASWKEKSQPNGPRAGPHRNL